MEKSYYQRNGGLKMMKLTKNYIKKHLKLSKNSGETLVETLVALLVVTLAVVLLAGSIVSAAKVNKSAEDFNTAFNVGEAKAVEETVTVKIVNENIEINIEVNAYKTDDENGYCYYEKKIENIQQTP